MGVGVRPGVSGAGRWGLGALLQDSHDNKGDDDQHKDVPPREPARGLRIVVGAVRIGGSLVLSVPSLLRKLQGVFQPAASFEDIRVVGVGIALTGDRIRAKADRAVQIGLTFPLDVSVCVRAHVGALHRVGMEVVISLGASTDAIELGERTASSTGRHVSLSKGENSNLVQLDRIVASVVLTGVVVLSQSTAKEGGQ